MHLETGVLLYIRFEGIALSFMTNDGFTMFITLTPSVNIIKLPISVLGAFYPFFVKQKTNLFISVI